MKNKTTNGAVQTVENGHGSIAIPELHTEASNGLNGLIDDSQQLQSDLKLNIAKLRDDAISQETKKLNSRLQDIERHSDKWYNVGPAEFRRRRRDGLTSLPGATLLPSAKSSTIPSREGRRYIPIRTLRPKNRDIPPIGLFLHLHGGGWVLNDEKSSDLYLQWIADSCNLVCVSVGYRLAPEHPFPAAFEDCVDAAKYMVDQSISRYGAPFTFMGGESAGANLSVLVALDLLHSPDSKYANFGLQGLLLHYGNFSLHWQPGTRLFLRDPTLVIDEEGLTHFRECYMPGADSTQHMQPSVSPFYADLKNLCLPSILITCGTEDCLLEDNIFMATRWMLAGGEATLRLLPGSPHGFIMFPLENHGNAAAALEDVAMFVKAKSTTS